MIGLSALFLTIIYIGAIFVRKKFSSAAFSLIGGGEGHSNQLASATRRIARRMLFDLGLDFLPFIGGHRRKGGSGSEGRNGLSATDEIKLWWKSRRYRGDLSDGVDIEGRPPAEKPVVNTSPDRPSDGWRSSAEMEDGDQPVFVYTDRRGAAPEEGAPPEPQSETARKEAGVAPGVQSLPTDWKNSENGCGLDCSSGSSQVGRKTPEASPVRRQETMTRRESGQRAAPQLQRTSKLSDFYKNEEADSASFSGPREARPAESGPSGPNGAGLPPNSDRMKADKMGGGVGDFGSSAQDVRSPYPESASSHPDRGTPEPGAAKREAPMSQREFQQGKQSANRQRFRQSSYEKNAATEEAEDASSSRSREIRSAFVSGHEEDALTNGSGAGVTVESETPVSGRGAE